MKIWREKTKYVSRIVVILFLLVLFGVACFLVVHKFFPVSPLKVLSAKDVTFVAVLDEPVVLRALLDTGTVVLPQVTDASLARLVPGASVESLKSLIGQLPENTAFVGYSERMIALFPLGGEQACSDFASGGLLATEREGMCILHTSALDDALFLTKEGSVLSRYGSLIPDNVSGIKILLTENLEMEEIVTAAFGGVITPEALLARTLAAKRYPVMVHVQQNESQMLQVEGYVLFGKKTVPAPLQNALINPALTKQVPLSGGALLFAINREIAEAVSSWIAMEFGENVQKMAEHVILTLTEPLTPVGISAAELPDVSVLVGFPHNETGSWQAVLAGVNEDEKAKVQAIVEDSLTFLYGLTSTATTLPDRSRGVMVMASQDAVTTDMQTMSGVTMTTYTAQDEPRFVTSYEEEMMFMAQPGTMSGATLSSPSGATQAIPTDLPIPSKQAFILKLPLSDAQTIFVGIAFLPDRMKFDLVLTPRI